VRSQESVGRVDSLEQLVRQTYDDAVTGQYLLFSRILLDANSYSVAIDKSVRQWPTYWGRDQYNGFWKQRPDSLKASEVC
jgi:hypothetical protein